MSIAARRFQRVNYPNGPIVAAPPTGAYSQTILADNPTIYYPMQEQSGTTMLDVAGNNKHGSYEAGVVVDYATNPYQYAPVALGRNVQLTNFWSNTSYIQLPANAIDTTNGFSFETWYYPIAWGYNSPLFCFGSQNDISLMHGYNDPTMTLNVNGQSLTFAAATDNVWHHLVVTIPKSGGSAKVYYDGAMVASGTVGSLLTAARPSLYVGRMLPSDTNGFYGGSLSQMAVYPTDLSASQVQAHYLAGLADADPVVHGTPEWNDHSFFTQFTNGAVLANTSMVPIADWMPAVGLETEVIQSKQYFNVAIQATDVPYTYFRDNGMWLLDKGNQPAAGTRGSETIGIDVGDEYDMGGPDGYSDLQADMALMPAGYMTYVNYGVYVILGEGSPDMTPGDFTNYPGVNLQSADFYWYSMNSVNPATITQDWGIQPSQFRRACNYGIAVQHARSHFDVPRPQWGFVELAHPYSDVTKGGPNPNQVEGAAWACIVGGARGVIWFHHSFAWEGVPPDWSSSTVYVAGNCVVYNGVYFYAALDPAVGEVPDISSYTWVRWSNNSGAGLLSADVRHPDLLPKLSQINQDFQAMAPAINSPTTQHLCHQSIYSTYRPDALDGKKYIIAVPGPGAPNGGTFSMHVPKGQNPSSIEVVGESRTITPSGGMFTDTFAAEYSHHIYRWT